MIVSGPMQPGHLERGLSKQFQRPPYQATKTWRPKYTNTKQVTTCDECFASQHESGGRFGPRRKVAATRTMPDKTRMYLCQEHADLWKALDALTDPKKQQKRGR
ncbi:hypothetical protein [Tsukamurella sp. NPDC003166]|uniref:hypothetical protein n=1 Tax=Tsukamurella sp. NPDC003166 TaxID=3154444 RepID=UPI0033BB8759